MGKALPQPVRNFVEATPEQAHLLIPEFEQTAIRDTFQEHGGGSMGDSLLSDSVFQFVGIADDEVPGSPKHVPILNCLRESSLIGGNPLSLAVEDCPVP